LLTWGDVTTGESQLQWRLETEGDETFLVLSGTGLSSEVRSDAIAPDQFNQRLHIAVVVQATQVQFFVDGTLAGTRSKAATSFSLEGGDLYLGRGFDDATYLHGTLQEVRLWRVARSTVDLQQTLHQQLTGAEAGLIGYWRLDSVTAQGTIPDLSFNHTDLAAGGILSVYQPQLTLHPEVLLPNPVEQVAQVLNFDAQHYGVTVVNPQDHGLGHYEQFSLQLWFLATDPGATDRKQILLTQGDTETGLSLYLFGGELYVHAWCLDDGTLNQHTLKRSDIDANQWHQVSVVYDEIASRNGVSYRLYLDGTEADATDDGFRLDQVGPIHLGGLTAAVITRFDDGETVGNSHHFAGQLTDLRLWKTALSAETITVPPDAQHPRHIAPTNHPDLLCYLPMTEGYGAPVGEHTGTRYAPTTDNPTLLTPVIYDQTPQGHHGNLVVGPPGADRQ
ncbi:MAG: LamG domain-containing protein, partial [Cyanobacteria bacterium J06636_28]